MVALSQGYRSQFVRLTTHIHPVWRLKIIGATYPLPPTLLKTCTGTISLTFFFIVAPCIFNSKTSHSPTNALFIKLGKV
jgi:hypothetical protein